MKIDNLARVGHKKFITYHEFLIRIEFQSDFREI